MPQTEIAISQGIQINANVAYFAASPPFLLDDGTLEVDVHTFVEDEGGDDDQEQTHVLHPGDTFQVRDQTWKLDHVENLDTDDWLVYIVRVA